MRLKKLSYLLLIILMLIAGINGIEAKEEPKYTKTCVYISSGEEFKATLTLNSGYPTGFMNPPPVVLEKYAGISVKINGEDVKDEPLNSWIPRVQRRNYTVKGDNGRVHFGYYYNSDEEANNEKNLKCPKYLVFQWKNKNDRLILGTDSETKVKDAMAAIESGGEVGYYATYGKMVNGVITEEYTAEDYWGDAIADVNPGVDAPVDCNSLLGDASDEKSIRYMINTIMTYVRILVPILIICLGSLDFAKAVFAGKEDIMKQAQTTFVKRLAAGVCVFLSPLLINIIMELAEITWAHLGFSTCQF